MFKVKSKHSANLHISVFIVTSELYQPQGWLQNWWQSQRFTGKSAALLRLMSDPRPRERRLHQPTLSLRERVPWSFQVALQFTAGQTEFPVHNLDLRLTFTISEIPLQYRLPVCGLVHTKGSRERKGKMLLVHPWGLSWVLHGSLLSCLITCGAYELPEMILCAECCFGTWENWVSLATQLLWSMLENTPWLTFLILKAGLPHRLLWS